MSLRATPALRAGLAPGAKQFRFSRRGFAAHFMERGKLKWKPSNPIMKTPNPTGLGVFIAISGSSSITNRALYILWRLEERTLSAD
jgi:hypothetical protein